MVLGIEIGGAPDEQLQRRPVVTRIGHVHREREEQGGRRGSVALPGALAATIARSAAAFSFSATDSS